MTESGNCKKSAAIIIELCSILRECFADKTRIKSITKGRFKNEFFKLINFIKTQLDYSLIGCPPLEIRA